MPVPVTHDHRTVPILSATDYIPYNASKKASVANNDPILHTRELDRVKKLALPEKKDEEIRAAMEKEKEELHEKSLNRAKGWKNTIMGMRRQRLAARDERMKKQEEERQKIDEEWAKVKEAEKQEAISRARYLQRVEEPRIKQLHSALMLSNIIQERDLQIAANYQQQLQQETLRQEEERRQREADERARRAEHEAQIRARAEAQRIAKEQQQQAKQRTEAKKHDRIVKDHPIHKITSKDDLLENVTEDEYWIIENKKAAQAAAQERAAERQKMLKQQEAQRKALDEAKALHEMEERKNAEKERLSREENEKFAQMKHMFEEQRKQAERKIVRDRQDRSEQALRVAAEQRNSEQRARSDFYERNVHAHDGYWEKRFAAEEAKRQKALKEEAKYQVEHSTEIKERREREKQEGAALRRRFEQEAAEQKEKEQSESRAVHGNLGKLSESYKQEIQTHQNLTKQQREAKLAEERALLKSLESEDEQFEEYAMEMVREWQQAGKDVKPLLRVLRQARSERKGAQKPRPPGQIVNEVNTFSRLGFPGRA